MSKVNQENKRTLLQKKNQNLPESSEASMSRESKPLFEKQLLTYRQAAQYLSISETYLRRLKNNRIIPCVLVSNRGIRFSLSSLNNWIEKREVK